LLRPRVRALLRIRGLRLAKPSAHSIIGWDNAFLYFGTRQSSAAARSRQIIISYDLFIGAWQDEVRMFFKHDPKPDDPKVNPDWQPPTEPVYQYLFQEALFGWNLVYFRGNSIVPLEAVRPIVPARND
jgi:hypothetical protein